MRFIILSLLAITTFATQAIAAGEGVVPQAPQNATVVYLSETAVEKVAQDKVRAMLEIQVEAPSAEAVQSRINRAMEKALDSAKRYSKVEASTGNYNVYQHYNRQKKEHDGWEGRQSIELDSADAAAVLKLVTALQDMGFKTNSLNYYLSADKRRDMRDDLLTSAVAKIQQRAAKVAKQLNKQNVHLAEISLQDNNDGGRPPVLYRTEMAAMAKVNDTMPEAQVQGKDEDVILTVNATVYLQD